jgi:hypothetical protein
MVNSVIFEIVSAITVESEPSAIYYYILFIFQLFYK